jgi:site-specific DNA-cytosine methylase
VPLTMEEPVYCHELPAEWRFGCLKAKQYHQIGNAFSPPVGRALDEAIRAALETTCALLTRS